MRTLLLISVFLVATCGLVYELVAGALASYLLGDSVLQFSTIIGTYLFAMGIGSYVSRYFERGLIATFIQVQFLVGLIGGTSTAVLYITFGYGVGFRVVLYLLVGAIGALVGLEIPLLLRILKDELEFKELVSQVLALDYIGALAASILFPLFLVPRLGLMRTAFFFGVVNVVVALIFVRKFRESADVPWVRAEGVFILLVLVAGFFGSTQLTSFAEESLYVDEVILTKSTPYQRITVTQRRSDIRLYLNGNLQFASADEYRYHEALVYPALGSCANPASVLVLGGGDGMAVRELLKDPRVQLVTLVELDPEVANLFQRHPHLSRLNKGSLRSPKVRIIQGDAFVWLKNTEETFDLAIVDFPDPSNYSVGKLYTNFFYRTLRSRMNPGGVATVQCSSPMYARKSFWCVIETMKAAGFHVRPYHAFVPSFGEWGYALISLDRTPEEIPVPPNLRFLTPATCAAMFEFPTDMAPVKADVNRLFDQALVRYYQADWRKILE